MTDKNVFSCIYVLCVGYKTAKKIYVIKNERGVGEPLKVWYTDTYLSR